METFEREWREWKRTSLKLESFYLDACREVQFYFTLDIFFPDMGYSLVEFHSRDVSVLRNRHLTFETANLARG